MHLTSLHANGRCYVLNKALRLKPEQSETGLWVIAQPQYGVTAGALHREDAQFNWEWEFDRIWRTHVEWKSRAPFVEQLTALVKEIRRG